MGTIAWVFNMAAAQFTGAVFTPEASADMLVVRMAGCLPVRMWMGKDGKTGVRHWI